MTTDTKTVKRLKACGLEQYIRGESFEKITPAWKGRRFVSKNAPDLTDDAMAAKYVLPVVDDATPFLHVCQIHPDIDEGPWFAGAGTEYGEAEFDRPHGYGKTFGQALVTFLDALIEAGEVEA